METSIAVIKSIVEGSALVLLFLVLAGGWRILKPAVDGWLEQHQQLLNVVIELTKSLALINANLEEITNRLGSLEEKAESRHEAVMRGLKGKLGRGTDG